MPLKFTVIATISALALSTVPALTQTAGTTTPAQPTQNQNAPQSPGATDQESESMQNMMREMMQEMMGQQSPRAERQRERRAERQRERRAERSGPGRWRDRDQMHRPDRMPRSGSNEHRQMMRGDHGGMGGGMHGTRMKIMFAIMDADGDGALALEEIQDFQERIFNAVDQNGDGSVEVEEIQSFFHSSDEDQAE